MAIRLQSEFRTSKDDQYKVKIIDSAFNATATEFNLGGDGFTLTHDGETDEVYSPIVGSSASLTIFNDSSAVDEFRTALLNAQDKQFSVRIERWKKPATRTIADDYRNRVLADGGTYEAGDCVNDALTALGVGTETRSDIWQQYTEERVIADGGTFEASSCVIDAINALGSSDSVPDEEFDLFWLGYIAQDLIEEADESKPRVMQIRASDGISVISTQDYQFTLSQSRTTNLKDVLIDILQNANIDQLFESDETMLTSVVNWYADEHVHSSALDPLANTRTDLKAFTTFNSDGTREYTNALEVVREIAKTFNARFYFDNGSFRFEQISERDRLEVLEFRYLNNGSFNNSSEVSLDTLIDQNTAHRSRGVFRYLPAVKSVVLSQQRVSSANIIGRSVVFPADEIDVGAIPSANNGRIILQMKSELQTFISNSLQGVATPIFAVTIRLEPTDGSATKYYKNILSGSATASPFLGAGSWSTTSDTFKWAANTISRSTSQKTTTQFAMTTAPLPTDGEIFIDIEFFGFYDFGIDATFIASPNSYAYSVTLQTAQFENDNDASAIVESIYTANNTSANLGSNISLDLGSTRLGDGAGAVGSLYVYNNTTWVPSTGWRANNIGAYSDILKLATRETLALQSSVVHRFEGVIINAGSFSNRLRFDMKYWLPMRSVFTANLDELEVEAFKIARVIDDTEAEEPSDVASDALVASVPDFNGTFINIASGSLAGMDISDDDKSVGPYRETASGTAAITENTQIVGTADITGATTMPSAQLTGGTGAQGTMVWNGDEDTIALTMNGIDHELGQDMMYNVKNQSGSTIPKGVAVRASGTLGSSGRILIERMSASGDIPARFYLGVTAEEIANGEDGKIIEFGKIRQIDTSMYSDGDVLWLNPATAGTFTATEPTAPDLKIATAFVIHSHPTNGVIMVRANQGHKLQDAHDVRITSLADGDILRWSNDLQVWYNTPLPT